MSELLSPEREALYRDLGLEELLEEPEPRDPNEAMIVGERRDSFGNELVLMWDPTEQVARLYIEGVEIETSAKAAYDALYHTYPVIASKVGEKTLGYLTHESEQEQLQ